MSPFPENYISCTKGLGGAPKAPKVSNPAPVAATPAPLGRPREATQAAQVVNPEEFRRIPADPRRRDRRRLGTPTPTGNTDVTALTGAALGSGV